MDLKKRGLPNIFSSGEYISPARRAATPPDVRELIEPPREVIDWNDRNNLGGSRPQAVLRQYHPETRERIAQTLMGDEKATSLRGRLVEGIMGTTGLGRGTGIVDFIPGAGTYLGAEEALSDAIHGNYLGAAEGLFGMLPLGKMHKGITKQSPGRTGWGGAPAADDLGPASSHGMNSTTDYPGRMTLREAADDPAVLPPHEQLLSKEDELKRAYGLSRQEYERNNAPGKLGRDHRKQAPYYGM